MKKNTKLIFIVIFFLSLKINVTAQDIFKPQNITEYGYAKKGMTKEELEQALETQLEYSEFMYDNHFIEKAEELSVFCELTPSNNQSSIDSKGTLCSYYREMKSMGQKFRSASNNTFTEYMSGEIYTFGYIFNEGKLEEIVVDAISASSCRSLESNFTRNFGEAQGTSGWNEKLYTIEGQSIHVPGYSTSFWDSYTTSVNCFTSDDKPLWTYGYILFKEE